MKSKIQKSIFLFFLILLNTFTYCHRPCGAGFLKAHRILAKPPEENTRYLSEDKWESLRIHLDYSFIENHIGKYDKQDLIDLKEKIMPKTVKVFESLLKVRRLKSKLKFNNSMCEQYPIPEKYDILGEGVNADLVIFVMIDDTGFFLQNRIEAAAIHCLQHTDTRRPIAGYIQFKPQLDVSDKTAEDYMVWLAIHEITHILAFNDGLFQDYIDKDLNPIGEKAVLERRNEGDRKITYIVSPNVVQKAREHFGCSSLRGVPLEYNGGPGTAGAHWAKKFMNTDYMIGDSYGENLFSTITIALFNDSGWYSVDYDEANLFLWGKNVGCAFFDFNKKCLFSAGESTYSMNTPYKVEFCTNFNKQICSTSNIFRGRCSVKKFDRSLPSTDQYFDDISIGGVDPLAEHCPIVIEEKRGQNYYGGSCRVGSRFDISDYETICPDCACFMSSLSKSGTRNIIEDERKKSIEIVERFRFLSKKNKIQLELNKEIKKEKESKTEEKTKSKTDQNSNQNEQKPINSKESNKLKGSKPNSITSKDKNEIPDIKDIKETSDTKNTKEVKDKEKTKNPATINQKSNENAKKQTRIKTRSDIYKTESNYKAACIKFSCNSLGTITLHIHNLKIPCSENGGTKIPGYSGEIICPSRDILCNQNFMCKFGCIERYESNK